MNFEIRDGGQHTPISGGGITASAHSLTKRSSDGLGDTFDQRSFGYFSIGHSKMSGCESRRCGGRGFRAIGERINPAHRRTMWNEFFDGRVGIQDVTRGAWGVVRTDGLDGCKGEPDEAGGSSQNGKKLYH